MSIKQCKNCQKEFPNTNQYFNYHDKTRGIFR